MSRLGMSTLMRAESGVPEAVSFIEDKPGLVQTRERQPLLLRLPSNTLPGNIFYHMIDDPLSPP